MKEKTNKKRNLKNKVINKKELQKELKIKGFLGSIIASIAMKSLKLDELNKMYDTAYDEDCATFVENCLQYGNNKIAVSQADMNVIPKTGALICLFNHPYGGLDALAIIKTMLTVRPDMKFVANFMLRKVKPLEPSFLKVNPFETQKSAFSSIAGLKEMYNHLNEGKCLCIFPAGEVSSYQQSSKTIEDRDWGKNIIKFIKKSNAPVISGFVSGKNSSHFYRLGKIHPLLRTLRLPAELLNKQNLTVNIRLSGAMPAKEIRQIDDLTTLGNLLKAKTYFLKTNTQEELNQKIKDNTTEQLIAPIDKAILEKEIESIKKSDLLFSSKNFQCFLSYKKRIPFIFEELARLRELTFREVGEGTGKEKDADEYDNYYKHLFIWNEEESALVGAYRIGMGADIMGEKGSRGFFLTTLFKKNQKLDQYLAKSMEMGRSFIVPEYQRRPLPLFLLWKGIYSIIRRHPNYQYLIGSVSISNNYPKSTIALILEYIENHHSSPELASMITGKTPFEYEVDKNMEAILNNSGDNLSAFDKTVRDLDANHMGIPILIKKYISLGGKILKFNVDPDFNYSIDGFVILNIKQLPQKVIDTYS